MKARCTSWTLERERKRKRKLKARKAGSRHGENLGKMWVCSVRFAGFLVEWSCVLIHLVDKYLHSAIFGLHPELLVYSKQDWRCRRFGGIAGGRKERDRPHRRHVPCPRCGQLSTRCAEISTCLAIDGVGCDDLVQDGLWLQVQRVEGGVGIWKHPS